MGCDSNFQLAKIRFRLLQKKSQELGIHEDDSPLKAQYLRKHKGITLNVVKFFVAVVILLLVVLCSILFGYVKGYVKYATIQKVIHKFSDVHSTEPCMIPYHELVLDVFRPPVNCSFCKGITKFDRVTNLSSEVFVRKYAYSGRPVIIEDAQTNWTAQHTFSFDFFKDTYKAQKNSPVLESSGKDCQFFRYKTKFEYLKDVFDMPKERVDMKGEPWYIGWSNCDPGAANIFRQHYKRPYFLSSDMESSRTDWIFMGTPGFGAHLHIDNVQQSSWQAQLGGDKEWYIEPPPECYYHCPKGFKDTIRVGETIVLDTNRWFHQTNVVGKKLSIVIGSEYD